MEKEEFVQKVPFLYHLTDRRNFDSIKQRKCLLSTVELANSSQLDNPEEFLQTRRPFHSEIALGEKSVFIRDQRPLNKALEKCLTDNWQPKDFIYHLNGRVFMWPNIKRLDIHYQRYKDESPLILKFDSVDIFGLNKNAEFSRINSGATRPSGVFGGKAAPRGPDTFKDFKNYLDRPGSVVEVTFPIKCLLPDSFYIGFSPDGIWKKVKL